MDTKLKGDIAEVAVSLEALKRGYNVLTPIGDRLGYDLVFDINSWFIKIQVKAAWLNKYGSWCIDNRKCKTNRGIYKIEKYIAGEFDFAIAYIDDNLNKFYVIPFEEFNSYGSSITLYKEDGQRTPKAAKYAEAWHLIEKFGADGR